MHELGLCDAMLRMMDKILTEEEPGAFSIRRVVLEIGELSGVCVLYTSPTPRDY